MNLTNKIITLVLVTAMAILSGCAAMQTTLEHKDLKASSQMSESIMMDPVPDSKKTVHLTFKNTSDQEMEIASKVKTAIESHGYKVVSNPNRAHYLLQAKILKVGEMSKSASQSALGGGYGSGLAGFATGAALGSLSYSANTTIGAGVVGGLVSMAADSLVKDVNYTMITDIQISERVTGYITEKTSANIKNGSATALKQSSSKRSSFQKYRTRVVSNADKVNLKFAEARPVLEQSLAKTIAGIF